MAIQRMDNVAIVVDDLDAAAAFFTGLGMEPEGKAPIEGLFADRTVGLDGVRSEIALGRYRVEELRSGCHGGHGATSAARASQGCAASPSPGPSKCPVGKPAV